MRYDFLGYYNIPKEGLRILTDVAFTIENGTIVKRPNLELPNREKIINTIMGRKDVGGMNIDKFRLRMSYEISSGELLNKFKSDVAQYAWAVVALLNAQMPNQITVCDIIERKSFIPTPTEILFQLWSDAVANYSLPFDVGLEGDFVNFQHLMDKLLIPVRDLVNLWHQTYRQYREARSYVIFSYLQNVIRDKGIESLGYTAPLLPYTTYAAFDVSTREPVQYSIELLERGSSIYSNLIASGMYNDSDALVAKYIRSYKMPKNENYTPKRILAPNFSAPTAACVWILDQNVYPHGMLNVSRYASEIVTNLFAILPSVKDRAIYSYLKRNNTEEEYIMLQSNVWKHCVAGSLWNPSPLQDLYKVVGPIRGCPIKLEQNQDISNMDIAVSIADIYENPITLPMTTSIDRSEGNIIETANRMFKDFPPVYYYEPANEGGVVPYADLSEFLTPSQLLLDHSMPSLKYVCACEWWTMYIKLFIDGFNFTDYEFILDTCRFAQITRIAKIMGYRETEEDASLLRILSRSKVSLVAWLFDLVVPGLGTLFASRCTVEMENLYFIGRSPSMLKKQ